MRSKKSKAARSVADKRGHGGGAFFRPPGTLYLVNKESEGRWFEMVIVRFQQWHTGDQWEIANAQTFSEEEALDYWGKEGESIREVLWNYSDEDQPFFLRQADWSEQEAHAFDEHCKNHYERMIDAVNELSESR